MQFKEGTFSSVEFQVPAYVWHKTLGELDEFRIALFVVDLDRFGRLVNHIAKHTLCQRQVLIEQRRSRFRFPTCTNLLPESSEIRHILLKLFGGGSLFCTGTDDIPAFLRLRANAREQLFEVLTHRLVFDSL